MKRFRELVWLILAVGIATPWAAQADAPIALMATKTGSLPMGRFVELLEDPGGKLTLEDVRSTENSGRFQPSGAEQVNIGYSHSVWWLRFCLRTTADAPRNLLL